MLTSSLSKEHEQELQEALYCQPVPISAGRVTRQG
jgi:hypothetical protein